MNPLRIIFFGSTSDSVIVLSKLHSLVIGNWSLEIVSVVTQPPRPVGRNQIVTSTPVETWAKEHNITTLSFPSNSGKPWLFANENQVIDTLQPMKADILVSACYGQRIPWEVIKEARLGGLNVHPSLLPRWRGADPVPWAILSGDHQTGVTVVTLSEKFDEGRIIVQKKVSITDTDTSEALRTKLFTLGADLLVEVLPECLTHTLHSPFSILHSPSPYARRLTREDGFEPWETIQKAFGDPEVARRIDRKFRAFFPWPGLWTLLRQGYGGQAKERRLKILSLHLHPTSYPSTGSGSRAGSRDVLHLNTVQWEGKKPISYSTLLTASGKRLHLF